MSSPKELKNKAKQINIGLKKVTTIRAMLPKADDEIYFDIPILARYVKITRLDIL